MRPRRITMRDESLPHQIVLRMVGSDIAVSCNCMRGIDGTQGYYAPLEVRSKWEATEAQEIYQQHLDRRAVIVPIGVGRVSS